MIQRYNKILILFLLVLVASNAFAQQIKGVVTDSVTHEPLMYISVYYQEKITVTVPVNLPLLGTDNLTLSGSWSTPPVQY